MQGVRVNYYEIFGTFNVPTSYLKWMWEREADINWSIHDMVTCQGSPPFETSLRFPGPVPADSRQRTPSVRDPIARD